MNDWSNNSSIDWQELDRLVDGRLDDDAYRELLCQIDADPDGWKQCAMAFLEHQALEKELSAFASDPSSQMLPCMGASTVEKEAGLDDVDKVELKPASGSVTGAVIGWMSMALCIVAGLALGFTLNDDFRDRLAPAADLPLDVENGMNQVIASNTPPVDSHQATVSDNDQLADDQLAEKEKRCRRKTSCWSQRNRTSLENFKTRWQVSDPFEGDDCPMFRFMDENE